MNQNPDKRATLVKNIAARIRQQFGECITVEDASLMVGITASSLARFAKLNVQDRLIKTEEFAKWIATGSKRLTHFSINVGDPAAYPDGLVFVPISKKTQPSRVARLIKTEDQGEHEIQ